jgi:hypothetical protein
MLTDAHVDLYPRRSMPTRTLLARQRAAAPGRRRTPRLQECPSLTSGVTFRATSTTHGATRSRGFAAAFAFDLGPHPYASSAAAAWIRGQNPHQVKRQRPMHRQRPPPRLRLHAGGNRRLWDDDRQLVGRAGDRHQRLEHQIGPGRDGSLRRQATDREQRRVQLRGGPFRGGTRSRRRWRPGPSCGVRRRVITHPVEVTLPPGPLHGERLVHTDDPHSRVPRMATSRWYRGVFVGGDRRSAAFDRPVW